MKLRLAIAGAITLALVVGILQRAEITRLRGLVEQARGRAEEAEQMRRGSAELPEVEMDTKELERLRGKHLELMRLRSEMPELRAAARAPEEIKEEIAEMRKRAAEATERAELIVTRRRAHELSKATESFVGAAGYLIDRVAVETGQRPSSWAELRQSLAEAPPGPLARGWERLGEAHNFAGVTFESFEFLPPGSRFILREKKARYVPERGWAKFYLLQEPEQRSLQTKEVVLADGAFEEWEQGEMLVQGDGKNGGE